MIKEIPGFETPWREINLLLSPEERFKVISPSQPAILLVPRSVSTLAALLFVLYEKELKWQACGTHIPLISDPVSFIWVSYRAFSSVSYDDQEKTITCGAGCSFSQVTRALCERKREVPLEEELWSSSQFSIGESILFAKIANLAYQGNSFINALLGLECVSVKGDVTYWGSWNRSGYFGPPLHSLLLGYRDFPGIVTRLKLKTYEIPQKRLYLTWQKDEAHQLWEQLDALQTFTSNWEKLECIQSGHPTDAHLIFAQIAGSIEEMKDFSLVCPSYSEAMQEKKNELRDFFKKKSLNSYVSSLSQTLSPGEYLWFQPHYQKVWWLSSKMLCLEKVACPPWKTLFNSSMIT